jgi:hypothetical protein
MTKRPAMRTAHPTDAEAAAGKPGRRFVPPLVPAGLMDFTVFNGGPYINLPEYVWNDIAQFLKRHGSKITMEHPNYATAGKPYHVRPGPKTKRVTDRP